MMTDYLTKIGVLLAFALAMLFLNLKLNPGVAKVLSYLVMLASFGGAGYFVVLVVLA